MSNANYIFFIQPQFCKNWSWVEVVSKLALLAKKN